MEEEGLLKKPEQFLLAHARGSIGLPSDINSLRAFVSTEKLDADGYETSLGRREIIVCIGGLCDTDTRRIRFRLAYPMHIDRGGGVDSWDMVFAPVTNGSFTVDTPRIVLRFVGSGGGFGDLVAHRETNGLGLEPRGHAVTLVDLSKTDVGQLAASYATVDTMLRANRIDAPLPILELESSLLERTAEPPRLPLASQIRELIEGPIGSSAFEALRQGWLHFVPQFALVVVGLFTGALILVLKRLRK